MDEQKTTGDLPAGFTKPDDTKSFKEIGSRHDTEASRESKKSKRGRPKLPRDEKGNIIRTGEDSKQEQDSTEIKPDIIAQSIITMWQTSAKMWAESLERKANQANIPKAEEFRKGVEVPDYLTKTMQPALTSVVEQYLPFFQYAPAVTVSGCLIIWTTNSLQTNYRLNKLIEDINAANTQSQENGNSRNDGNRQKHSSRETG
jgi:hypothetical protein